jgi:hypothetical protein
MTLIMDQREYQISRGDMLRASSPALPIGCLTTMQDERYYWRRHMLAVYRGFMSPPATTIRPTQ